jgi:hypothetical protein
MNRFKNTLFSTSFSQKWRIVLLALLGTLGTALLCLNIYGLTQDIRPKFFPKESLRFANDTALDYEHAIKLTSKQNNESPEQYAHRMTKLISSSLMHIQWTQFEPEKFNQIVPLWENYILFFMGKLSGIPEYERYHFASYERSIKRGIGVCGDASMILSQLLDQQGIKNSIVSYPKHVIVSAQIEGNEWVLDPDFGVVISSPLDDLSKTKSVELAYLNEGYTPDDLASVMDAFDDPYQKWRGVSEFITNKYYFEKVSYFLKWFIPLVLIWPFTHSWILRTNRLRRQEQGMNSSEE